MKINKIKLFLLHYTWDLAYGRYDESVIKRGINWKTIHHVRNPYAKKWFADPFILEEDEHNLHLLVEEFDSDVRRGRIAHIIIDKQSEKITTCNIILDLPTHLSFPAIYRQGREIYVYPENSKSGSSFIYRYDLENERLVDPIMLVNKPLADAIIHYENGGYCMYATQDPEPNGNTLIKLYSDSLLGTYQEKSSCVYPSNCARMAGQILDTSFSVIRPAQDCNGAYGRAVWFMQDENIVSVLKPNCIKYAGIHTFNTMKSTYVIDFKKYDFPYLYYIKEKFKR